MFQFPPQLHAERFTSPAAGTKKVVRDIGVQAANIAKDALEELSLRLEETPETFTTNQLLEVSKFGADRSGFGPQSSSTNVNVNVDLASRLEAARRRVEERRTAVVIDVEGIIV